LADRFALNGDEGVAVSKRHLHHPDPIQKEMMIAWLGCFQKRQKVPGLYELANRICSPRLSVFLALQRSVHEADVFSRLKGEAQAMCILQFNNVLKNQGKIICFKFN
jgi:hypothetical protein